MTVCGRRSSTSRTTATPTRGPPGSRTRRRPRGTGRIPRQAARNFDTFFAKGRAQTWQVMGKGNWATDPNYVTKVIGIYIRMVVFAADQPDH